MTGGISTENELFTVASWAVQRAVDAACMARRTDTGTGVEGGSVTDLDVAAACLAWLRCGTAADTDLGRTDVAGDRTKIQLTNASNLTCMSFRTTIGTGTVRDGTVGGRTNNPVVTAACVSWRALKATITNFLAGPGRARVL